MSDPSIPPILGLVGGIAPESTVAYYRLLVDGYRRSHPQSYPRIVINSVDLEHFIGYVNRGDLPGLIDFLVAEVQRLAVAGAAVGAFASNTPHLVFDEVAARAPIPLVSIVEATAEATAAAGFTSVGLLGTRSTMEGSFYPEVLSRRGIAVHPPGPDDRAYVHEVYFGELAKGLFRPETRDRLLGVIRRLHRATGIEAVILGGTELPLILTSDEGSPVPLLDTARMHTDALLRAIEQLAP